jgi:hypothetical protein
VLLLFAFKPSFGQSAEDLINSIKLKTEAIDEVKTYKEVRLKEEQFLGNAPKGSELKGYFQNDRLFKSICSIVTSFGIEQTEYYYNNDTLLFARVTERHFKTKGNQTKIRDTKVVLEGKYYYNENGRIFSKKVNGHGNWEKTSDIMLMHYSNAYMKMLYKSYNVN